MSKLTIVRGVSGSGKSTWAESQPNALVVSRDRIRAAMFGSADQDYYAVDKDVLSRKENLVTAIQDESIAAGLRAGMHVIVDNTNVRPKFIKSIVEIGFKAGADIDVKVIDVPLATALERNAARGAAGGRLVPERVIREQHQALRSSIDWKPEAPFTPQPYHGTPGKPNAFLVDIDGTLAHMKDYRGPFDWAKVGLDDVDEVVAEIVDTLRFSQMNTLQATVVMSGRDESCRQQTEDWLDENGIHFDYLFMRPAGDMRKDSIVKAELFDKHVRNNFNVRFVLDDRPQVCRMWRAMGLKVLQVADPDVEF